MNIIKKAALGVIVSLFVPALAMAEGNLHLGPLELRPYVLVTESYSNNIYSTPINKKRDWYTVTHPGLRLNLPFRDNDMAAVEYSAVFQRYGKTDSENTTDHNANGLLDLKFGSLVGLKLTDAYRKGHEPRGSSSTGFIERFHTNDAAAALTYELADVSKVELDYTRTNWKFKTSPARDRDEDLASAFFYLKFLPKTSGFAEYDHKEVDYKLNAAEWPLLNNNSSVDSGSLGLTWEATETSKGTVKAGYLHKNFSGANKKDYGTWTASADINHDFSDYTALTLNAARTVNEATLSGTRYLISTGGYAELRHVFLTKFMGVVHGAISRDKFSDATGGTSDPTVTRRDLTVNSGAGLKYRIQDWLETGLDYTHKDRNSNLNENDYDENLYSISINFAL